MAQENDFQKKTWAKPEVIIIDRDALRSGNHPGFNEGSVHLSNLTSVPGRGFRFTFNGTHHLTGTVPPTFYFS